MSSFRAKLKPFVPPIAVEFLRFVGGVRAAVSFDGDYDSWNAAQAHATGYDVADILDRVVLATRRVVVGEAAYERDSVVFDRVEYSWPLLASLLQIAAERRSLRVIDFGGSLGSTLRQNRNYLGRLKIPLAWRVVEQEHFVAAGQEFADGILGFYRTIGEADRDGTDVVLFSSSLCYLRDPGVLLDQVAASTARYLILDRLPVIEERKDRIALQKVAEPIYTASYPVWLFSRDKLLRDLSAQWRLIESWRSELQPDAKSESHGFFLERR